MKKSAIKASLLALGLSASALAAAAPFNYSYVEGGFGELDNNGDAVYFRGGYDLNPNWGLIGGVYVGNADPDFDVTAFEFGAQYHQQLKSNLSFHAGLQLLHVQVDGNFGPFSVNEDDTGFIADAGLRFLVQPKLQLEGDAKLSSNDLIDDGLGLEVDARYYIDPKLSIAGGLAMDTELDGLFVNLRYDL